jgi:hypothetical protein
VPADRRTYRVPAHSNLMVNIHCHTCLIGAMSMRMALSSPLDLAVIVAGKFAWRESTGGTAPGVNQRQDKLWVRIKRTENNIGHV